MNIRVRTLPRISLPLSYQAPNGVARSLNSRLADAISLRDFGAIGDGESHPLSERFPSLLLAQMVYPSATSLTNEIDRVAIQKAFDSGKALRAGVGSYRLDARVTATDKSFSLVGDGIDLTRFLVTSAAGGIKIEITSQSATGTATTGGISKYVTIAGFSVVAFMAGSASCGDAINITFPANNATVAGSPSITIQDISIHGKNYWCDGTNPHWDTGLKLVNVGGVSIDTFSYMAIGDLLSTGIRINNDAGSNLFFFNLSKINVQGALYGLNASGWIEALSVSDFTLVGLNPARVDLSTNIIGQYLPIIQFRNGHMNGSQSCVYVRKAVSVQFTDVNLACSYADGVSGDLMVGFDFLECNDITIKGFDINNGFGTADNLIFFKFVSCWVVSVSDGLVYCSRTDGKIVRGFSITNGCQDVNIHNVTGKSGEEQPLSMFFVQNGSTVASQIVKIHHNTSRGWVNDVELYDPKYVEVTDNDFHGSNAHVLIVGTAVQPVIVERNGPAGDALYLPDAGETPTIIGAPDGRVFLSDGSAVNTTNFLGGRAGMQIIVGTDGNRTLVHGTNLKLSGGTNYTPAFNTRIAFVSDGTAWREMWRTA